MSKLFLHELKIHLKGIIGWSIGLILFGGLYISVYPQVGEQMSSLADLSIYQAMGMDLGTFEGYISSVVLGFLPLLLGVYAVILGTGTLAGEEDSGTLELVLSKPLTRLQVYSIKTAAIAVILALIVVITGIGDAVFLSLITGSIETAVTPVQLFTVVIAAWPVSMLLAVVGMFLGALMPNRRGASAITGLILGVSYFGENLTGMVEKLEPLQVLSIFAYYDSSARVFHEGVRGGDVGILLALTALFFTAGLLCFTKRDITVGTWLWKKARISSRVETKR